MANLECRMYESRYPQVDDVVMVKVDDIDEKGVSVSLLEYNNISGKMLFSTGTSSSPNTVVGRIEPFKVCSVNKRKKLIGVNRSVSFEERNECEKAFNKARYVRSVLSSVAEDLHMKLKDIYKITRWPSYEDLDKLGDADWFASSELRTALLKRIETMDYFSWRIKDPSILWFCILVQRFGICWAIALVRHLEAYLKLRGFLDKEKILSVQDLLDKAPPDSYDEEGDLGGLEEMKNVLQSVGLVLDNSPATDNSPITLALHQEPVQNAQPVYKVDRMRVFIESDDGEDDSVPEGYFDEYYIHDLKTVSPVAASVIWYPSYNGVKDDVIFKPTDDEYKQYKEDGGHNLPVHVMLLSGKGTDKDGTRYLEFQDCGGGDVGNGDRGYIRFARDPTPVIEYVRLTISRKAKRNDRGEKQ